jgi:hypothetical protein
MKDRRDAVRQNLPVAVEQRDVDRKADARPWHHLPLECIAMDIDDTRQHEQAIGIDAAHGRSRSRSVQSGDLTALVNVDGYVGERAINQHAAAFDPKRAG